MNKTTQRNLLIATGIILIAIPCFYLIANDAREKIYTHVSAWFGRKPSSG